MSFRGHSFAYPSGGKFLMSDEEESGPQESGRSLRDEFRNRRPTINDVQVMRQQAKKIKS